MRERELRITNPAGTDLRIRTTARFHINDGDASKAKAARAASARDREEEIPCGALRTVPVIDSVEGVIAYKSGFGYPSMGTGLDVDKWFDRGLRFIFERGRVVRVETDGDQAALDRAWAQETGDKDRLGEMVLGCNPLLRPVPGSTFRPYYGFGEGGLRLTVGENLESGGTNRSSLHRWLMFFDASIEAGGRRLLQDGRLVVPA
jgi:leucyl aminopeptidase (aminopeptidase T)